MVRRVRWSQQAADDLKAIHDHIALDSRRHARDFVRALREAAQSLKDMPFRGPTVPEFEPSAFRQLSFRGYRIIYQVDAEAVQLLAIVHGARDLRALWEREGRPMPPHGLN